MPYRFIRRSALRSAVFGSRSSEGADPWTCPPARDRAVVSGLVTDVGPEVLILQTAAGEQRLALTPRTRAWRGTAVSPTALNHGDHAILRTERHPRADGRFPAERIWAQIGRVTGTIVEVRGRELIIDEGPTRDRRVAVIEATSLRRVRVRFPCISPGYLIDVIGLRKPGYLLALTPATAQPLYRSNRPPTPPLVNGHPPRQVSGTATWHEPGSEPPGLRGVSYPALDPETGCDRPDRPDRRSPGPGQQDVVDPHDVGPGCVQLPYLSVGSAVSIRNECAGTTAILPVTSCGASSRLFCDRCVQCGTSPRGRIADLTMTAFAELGGNLDDGCFNATLAVSG
ncbi:MAG: hypothetical protein J2P25_02045 [Nocardiopsaceae bacterium]|nr:hypothetical protein [Nocardiopsaceae bacterium]